MSKNNEKLNNSNKNQKGVIKINLINLMDKFYIVLILQKILTMKKSNNKINFI